MGQSLETHWDKQARSMGINIQKFYASYEGQSVLAALRQCLPKSLEGAAVLDIGCGTGLYFPFFAGLGATRLVGVDIGEALLRICHQHQPHAGLARTDASRLPFPSSSFDVVISLGLLEHFEWPVPVLNEFARLVRPGGRLIIETPNALNLVFSYYKLVKRKQLAWEHWLAPWGLWRIVGKGDALDRYRFTSAVLMSWHLARVVGAANLKLPGLTKTMVRIERWWPVRYFGSMMFVAARRL